MLLPHLADRAVTRIRWPHGTGDMQFFEKNLPSGAPKWLHSVTVPSTGSRGGGDTISYPVIDGLADLTYFANLASLELHVHQWTVGRNGRPKNPNRMVIDLDPGHPAGLRECCEVALLVRDKLAERGLSAAPVTSRQQGPAHVRRAARQAQRRRGARPGPGDRAGAHRRAPEAGGLEDDQVAARRARCSSTGARTPARRPRSRRTRCAAATGRTSRRRAPGRRSRTGAEEGLGQLEMDDVLARVDEDGDIFGDLLGGA